MSYTALMLQTGAAFLQVATPMTADSGAWVKSPEPSTYIPVWSDLAYQFKFISLSGNVVKLDEKQSRVLHTALIASFNDFRPPIFVVQ